jgi:hypothetical protein
MVGKRAITLLALLSILATAFAPQPIGGGAQFYHSERSEESLSYTNEALRSAQGDKPTPIASYQIQVILDPAAKTLRGYEVLTYLNASSDTLPVLPFHLYLNAFRDSTTTFLRESSSVSLSGGRFDPNHPGWIEVDAARLEGVDLLRTAAFNDDRTVMTLTLPSPLAPGATARVELGFHAQLPQVFARTGFWEGDFIMVGQWFPKISRYDDQGWHSWPFHANAEFYADFGAYDVDITVPKSFVVGATGVLVRLQDQGDTKTEAYHADDVIDFAWTASPHYKTATRRAAQGVEITLLYQPENQKYVGRYLTATEQSLKVYGEWYGPYPYPRVTVVDPPSKATGAGGMEYPMLITAGVGALGLPEIPGGTVREAEIVVLHEMAHQWFYAVVATNEAQEPWLDEGMADFATVEAAARYYGEKTSLLDAPGLKLGYRNLRRLEYLAFPRVPMYGKAWDFGMLDYGVAAYSKPVVVLTTLKNILGAGTFGRVMRTYYERYRFKHPHTEDFIAIAQEVSRRDLKGFFDQTVYGHGVLDYAVESVRTRRADGRYRSEVVLARRGEVQFPVDVLMVFTDGSTQRQVWDGETLSQTLALETSAPLAYAALDPDRKFTMETNTINNSLTVQPELGPLLRLGSRWLFWMQAVMDFGL